MTTRAVLDQLHPWYRRNVDLWRRYRAFGESVDNAADKVEWLPQGQFEHDPNYLHRLRLSHDLGASPSAITRLAGGVMKGAASRDYSALDGATADKLTAFDKRAGGPGETVEAVLRRSFEEAAKMGISLLYVARPATPNAANAAAERSPIAELFSVEECINWGVADDGSLDWIILRRQTSTQAGPTATRGGATVWLVIDRFKVERYEVAASGVSDVGQDEPDKDVAPQATAHNLGVVPVVVHYGKRVAPMRGRSYIDALSRGDLRRFQLESDNAQCSYLHGNPRLWIKSTRKLSEIAADAGRVLILDPERNEDVGYATLDASGMATREDMIKAGDARAATLAGIDPAAIAADGSPKARSGAAAAWSFTTAEVPTLELFHESLVNADVELHGIVARFLSAAPLDRDQTFAGNITRGRDWTLLDTSDLASLASEVWDRIPSATWRRETATQLALRVPGNLPAELASKIRDELAKAPDDAFAAPIDVPPPPPFTPPPAPPQGAPRNGAAAK